MSDWGFERRVNFSKKLLNVVQKYFCCDLLVDQKCWSQAGQLCKQKYLCSMMGIIYVKCSPEKKIERVKEDLSTDLIINFDARMHLKIHLCSFYE